MPSNRVTIAQRRRLEREARARQGRLRRALDAVTRRTGLTPAGLILGGVAIAAPCR